MALTYVTVQDAIREVVKAMGLTNGEGMTPYSNELVISQLVSAHVLIRDEHEWGECTRWLPRTVNGVNGLITETIQGCSDWKLIKRIYLDSFQTPLPVLTSYTNPLNSPLLIGYTPLAPEDDLQPPAVGRYLVRFWPATNTGNVMFQITQEYDFSNVEMRVPIDFWLHVYGAAWQWAVDDSTNPRQEAKFQMLFKKRMAQVTALENSRPSFAQPNQLIPNDWWEQDAPYA